MKYVRGAGIALLIFLMGYLSGFGLFADSSGAGIVALIFIFIAGCAGVGALLPTQWQLSVLCSWGAILMVVLELANMISWGAVSGQQSISQLIFTGWVAIGLALLGGYLGSRLRRLT